jgi:lysophospholipase L1-like esterase
MFYPAFTATDFTRIFLRSFAVLFFSTTVMYNGVAQLRSPFVNLSAEDDVYRDFLNESGNRIEFVNTLDLFYTKLYELRAQNQGLVQIVHIGDSHIQGNYLTAEVRRSLQEVFGDAGRGLVFPYKLAKSNNPGDYTIESPVYWKSYNCAKNRKQQSSYGISGYVLTAETAKGELSVRLKEAPHPEFSRVTVFQHKTDDAYGVRVFDPETGRTADLVIEGEAFSTFLFDAPVRQANIGTWRTGAGQWQLTIDGICLQREEPGIMYHSIGVNGAMYADFVRSDRFASSLAVLQPDLIILSFGTNEAQSASGPSSVETFMPEMVRQLQLYAPGAAIMLTTPADSYLRGRYNPYLEEIAQIIRDYATQNNMPLWDLYQIGGGKRSASKWLSSGLLSRDKVHNTVAGYELQGKMLYQSLIKGYNDWVMGK